MNKSDLITKTHALLNKSCCKSKSKAPCEELISRASTENVINTILSAIAEGLKADGSVQIIGFGTFTINQRAARQGVNPRTGEKIRIAASKSIRFKAGSKFKEIL
ncbi:MAG: HU family DNA-binding protein [Puniceicoccales bacterium]|jgi:DNA-binding protein HU-beta|nr:HU family DNA-binding protein [Puniceicoccales bacterium]